MTRIKTSALYKILYFLNVKFKEVLIVIYIYVSYHNFSLPIIRGNTGRIYVALLLVAPRGTSIVSPIVAVCTRR